MNLTILFILRSIWDHVLPPAFLWITRLSRIIKSKKRYTDLISVNEGKIIGEILYSNEGVEYNAFSGVPYAQKPVGRLRFLPPQPTKAFNGEYEATKKGIRCAQKNMFGQIVGCEDCLYLNIYVPGGHANYISQGKMYPVMVYIHGGGFSSGSAGSELYGPDYFMKYDVILVTMNYRVGALGFLTLGNDEAPGNLALRDQQQCLFWIKSNIASFGGDNNNITIFGESAGAISCGIHLISPRAKGLFNKIIAQSGAFWDFHQLSSWKPDNGFKLAKLLGYPGDGNNKEEILSFLQEIDYKKIVRVALSFDRDDTAHTFTPCVDDFCNDPVMPEDGFKILEKGNYNKVPIIQGVCRDDGMVFSLICDTVKEAWDRMNHDWEQIGMLKLFNLPLNEYNESLSIVVRKIKDYYYGKKRFGSNTFETYTKLGGDRVFHAQCHLTCLLLSQTSHEPVFRYFFNYEGKHSLLRCLYISKWKLLTKFGLKILTGLDIYNKRIKGVCHADDTIYLFKNRYGMNSDERNDDILVRNHMLDLWTQFAQSGKPTLDIEDWPPYSHTNPHLHYEINSKSGIKPFDPDYKDRLDFWVDNVVPVIRAQ